MMERKKEVEVHLPKVDPETSVRDAVELMIRRGAVAVAAKAGDDYRVYSISVLGEALDRNLDLLLPEVDELRVSRRDLTSDDYDEIVISHGILPSLRVAPLTWVCPERDDFSWSSPRDCPNCGVPLVPQRS